MAPCDEILAAGAVRTVICDVYGTLLHAGPPPPDAVERWRRACQEIAGQSLTLEEFDARCAATVAEQHTARRAAGEPFPEVDWLTVVRTAMPGMDNARARQLSELHASCSRTCTALSGAVEALRFLHAAGILSGIASNAQHYTRNELTAAGFTLANFHPELVLFSGNHGFAKPSPRVFALLTERLAALGIAPHETLMIGDSVSNDLVPARAAGWQTCQVKEGVWEAIRTALVSTSRGS